MKGNNVLLFITSFFIFQLSKKIYPSPVPLVESNVAIAVITSPETMPRLTALHNTWRQRTEASVTYFMGMPNVTQKTFMQNYRKRKPGRHPFLNHTLMAVPSTDIVMLPVKEEGDHLIVEKTFEAIRYLYRRNPQFQWFLKCDDDTFVINSNLMQQLRRYNPNLPYFMGKVLYGNKNPSGGAGYLMSRGLLNQLLPYFDKCIREGKIYTAGIKDAGEDVVMNYCVEKYAGIKAIDVPGMYVTTPEDYMKWKSWDGKMKPWIDEPITFHWVNSDHMYGLDYLLYRVTGIK